MLTGCSIIRKDQKGEGRMTALVKTGMKLLCRMKAFWFFLCLTPVLSTIILKVKFDSSVAYMEKESGKVMELGSEDDKVAYNGGNGEYLIKVYDAAGTEVSEGLLHNLADSGLYMVARVDMTQMAGDGFTDEFVERHLERDGFEDRMGVSIYLYPGFSEGKSAEELADSIRIFEVSDDDRTGLLKSDIEYYIHHAAQMGSDYIDAAADAYANKTVVSIAGSSGRSLTAEQVNHKTQVGYAFAFMTLGFVFCGIFAAHIAIHEQKNGVYTRVELTGTSALEYFISKFISVLFISVMSTAVMGICTLVIGEDELGMNRFLFLLMIFLLGLIFGSVSLFLGILLGDVMSANVAAFSVWCFSALLSGLYFPLNHTSDFIKVLSSLMPQKWFLECTEMIFTHDNKALGMLICITAAYLAVVISLGGLGLKLRRNDEWGNS